MIGSKNIKAAFLVLLFLIIIFLLFWKLGVNYLTNWDEAWYADISRNMVQTKRYLTPIWNKETFFEKPPLYFWLSSLAFKIFGISEFSARFPSAFLGLTLAPLVYWLGKEIFHERVGLISVLILFSSPLFLYRSRTGNLDTPLTFWMTLSLFGFLKGLTKNSRWFLLMGFSLAFGFLMKGVIAFYPLASALIYLATERKLKKAKEKWFLIGILVSFLLISGWFLLSLKVNGPQFVNQFLLGNVGKFGLGLKSFRNFSLEYLLHLKYGLKIWFLFLIVSFFYSLYKLKQPELRFFFLYFLVFLLAMSFSENKSNWFILPLYPVIAIIISCCFYELAINFLGERRVWFLLIVVFLLATTQNFVFRNEYFVPDIAGDEARVALGAKKETEEDDVLYLTNYYYSSTIYYSQRKVYAIYAERSENLAWWILPQSNWPKILESERLFIITTEEELKNLEAYFLEYKFEVLHQSGEKILLKKV